jgi:hypothetical protein
MVEEAEAKWQCEISWAGKERNCPAKKADGFLAHLVIQDPSRASNQSSFVLKELR